MRRREFVGAAATLAVAAATGPRAAGAAPHLIADGWRSADIVADQLVSAFPRRQSLAAIGDAYGRSETDAGVVCDPCLESHVEGLLDHLGLAESEVRQMAPDTIRARIKAGTAADFTEGRIVRVKGWLLGEAEARLCMIAALRSA
ncbi:MAG: hypothetical protein AAF543_14665 [Pseudomonadota bacterium]